MDEIVIKIKPRHLERMVFALIIIALVSFIAIQRVPSTTSGNVVADVQETTVLETETIETTEPIVKEKVEETIVEEVVEEIPVEEAKVVVEAVVDTTLKAISGRRTFGVSDVVTTVKGDDWAKLDSFKLKIENGLSGVYVTYKIYLYDDTDNDVTKTAVQETVTLRKIDEGEIYEVVQEIGESFNDIDETKTLKIVFEDSTGASLDTYTKTFKA